MRILKINKFFYLKGGSEHVFFDTVRLLEKKGHRVSFFAMQHAMNKPSQYQAYFVSPVKYDEANFLGKLSSSGKLFYSWEARKKVESLIIKEQPDIAHLNNIYHQISPSILHSLKKLKIPVIMNLHDYKLVCGSYSMLNKNKPCQSCEEGKYYKCLLNNCFRDSRMKSLVSTIEMYLHHRFFKIYNLVDLFIAPSMFLKLKLKEMGFKGKVVYLPNFVDKDDYEPSYAKTRDTVIYFGRLSEEKGLFTLLDAAKLNPRFSFKLIGEGPLKKELMNKAGKEKIANVIFSGYKSGEALREEIRECKFSVIPSQCYENSPRGIIESFALGKPVVGANIGGIPELIRDNENGFLFEPGNAGDLAQKISLLGSDEEKIGVMGRNARQFVERELEAESYYQKLIEIYEEIKADYN